MVRQFSWLLYMEVNDQADAKSKSPDLKIYVKSNVVLRLNIGRKSMCNLRISDFKLVGWLLVMCLTALWDSIPVFIGPYPRQREKGKRNDRRQKNVKTSPRHVRT